MAVRCVWQVRKALEMPILGLGGITSANDAMEFVLAGASAVAVGTGNFLDPGLALRVANGMESYVRESGAASLAELVGAAHGPKA